MEDKIISFTHIAANSLQSSSSTRLSHPMIAISGRCSSTPLRETDVLFLRSRRRWRRLGRRRSRGCGGCFHRCRFFLLSLPWSPEPLFHAWHQHVASTSVRHRGLWTPQIVISRLRIGHTRLTHSFILKQEPQPQCLTCQTTYTVKHILIECRTFTVIRKQFFKVNNLTDLFENVKIDGILSFLRETELYQKIWQLKTS